MQESKLLQLLLAVSLCVLASLSPCTHAASDSDTKGKPVVTPINRDAATLLYTSPLKRGRPLLLDLAGPLVWTTCDGAHPTVDCHHPECAHAHSHHPPGCPHTGYGKPDDDDPFRCKCTAHPYNHITGRTATADLTRVRLAANTTDGGNPREPVSFSVVASCAPDSLLAKLPAGAVGVAGLAGTRLALPTQVSRRQKLANKFMLCLPTRSGSATGAAIFGGGPLFIPPSAGLGSLTSRLTYTPLLGRPRNPAYYLPVKGIAIDGAQLPVPGDALSIATGGVVLDTRVPYTQLRPDIYRMVVDTFERAVARNDIKIQATAPFELCYTGMIPTRIGYPVPDVDLMLEGGKNWTLTGRSSMVGLPTGVCFAFVKMEEKKGGYGGAPAPAVIIGGFQMEDHVLEFDLEKRQLGFGLTPWFEPCGNFNFTQVH
ncbi:hypothetical protein ACP70R_036107 [Stipagrostis hirtigluma subsp. patula]